MIGATYTLINDVMSNFKTGKEFKKNAAKGEKVKIISESYPAVIFERINGERFSTTKDNLKNG